MTHAEINIACAEALGYLEIQGNIHFRVWKTSANEATVEEWALPNFATSYDAAFTLVGNSFIGISGSEKLGWTVSLMPDGTTAVSVVSAKTLPLAICEAFLKANGK